MEVSKLKTEDFNFSLLGGSWQKSLLVIVFDFRVQNILKETDINLVFKVLAKFGAYKHYKDIKKKCGKKNQSIEGGWGREGGKISMEKYIFFHNFYYVFIMFIISKFGENFEEKIDIYFF